MKVLVTAGNTEVPIDRVRCITSVFTGRTGAGLALKAYQRGHDVTLLTSHPEAAAELAERENLALSMTAADLPRWRCLKYRTFDDLESLLEQRIVRFPQDAVIASAAVSDYRPTGIFAAAAGTRFQDDRGTWSAEAGPPTLEDRSAGKVKSDETELWLRLGRTPKLIDRVRRDWGFAGLLVKFKLEVGLSPQQLAAVAERSRRQSAADLIVANLYDGTLSSFLVGPIPLGSQAGSGPVEAEECFKSYQRIERRNLAERLFEILETDAAKAQPV